MLGKESIIRIRLAAIAAAALLTASPLSPLTLQVNGVTSTVLTLPDTSLQREHLIGSDSGELRAVDGVSLAESLPLFYDVYRMQITWDGGTTDIRSDDLERKLWDSIIFEDEEGTALWFDDELYTGVRTVNVSGSKLDARELEVWLSWEGTDLIAAEIDRFATLHDLEIETVVVPNTRSKLVTTDRAGGRPADVVMIQSDYLPDLTDSQALQPLRPSVQVATVQKGETAFDYAGHTWAAPFYFDSHLLFFNPELIPGGLPAGTPSAATATPTSDVDGSWNLAALEAACERILSANTAAGNRGVSRDIIPISWNAYSAYWLTPFVLGFGKDEIVSATGFVEVDDEPTREALQYVLDLRERGYLEVLERDAMTTLFTTGRVAMILTGSYAIPHFERLGIPFDVRPYPSLEGEQRHIVPFLDFKGWAVPRRAGHPVLAGRFIQHFSMPSVQSEFARQLRKMPAAQAAFELIRDDHPYFDALETSYRIGTPVPADRAYVVYKSLMWRLLRFAFTGQMTVDAVLQTGSEMLENSANER